MEAALWSSVFVTPIVEPGTILWISVVAVFLLVITDWFLVSRTGDVVVPAALGSSFFVAIKIEFGRAILGAIITMVRFNVTLWLLIEVALAVVIVPAALGTTPFVTIVIKTEGTIFWTIVFVPIVWTIFVVPVAPVIPIHVIFIEILVIFIVVKVITSRCLVGTASRLAPTTLRKAVFVTTVVIGRVGTIVGILVLVVPVIARGLSIGAFHLVIRTAFGLAFLVAVVVEFIRFAIVWFVPLNVALWLMAVMIALEFVVVATLWAAVLVTIVIGLLAIVWRSMISFVFVVALRPMILGTVSTTIDVATPGTSVFVALVIEPQGAVVDDGPVVIGAVIVVFVEVTFRLVAGTLKLVVEATLWTTVLIAIEIGLGGTVPGIARVSVVGVLVIVTLWLLPWTKLACLITFIVLAKAAAWPSVFVTLVVPIKLAIVKPLVAFRSFVGGTFQIVVKTALRTTKLVTLIVFFGITIVWIPGIIIIRIMVIARGLLPGTSVTIVLETTFWFSTLIAVIVQSKAAIVNAKPFVIVPVLQFSIIVIEPIVIVMAGVQHIAIWLMAGTVLPIVVLPMKTTGRFPIFITIVIKAPCTVVVSNYWMMIRIATWLLVRRTILPLVVAAGWFSFLVALVVKCFVRVTIVGIFLVSIVASVIVVVNIGPSIVMIIAGRCVAGTILMVVEKTTGRFSVLVTIVIGLL